MPQKQRRAERNVQPAADWATGVMAEGQKQKARLRKARRLLIVPFKTKNFEYGG
jgi:hypothetical protein